MSVTALIGTYVWYKDVHVETVFTDVHFLEVRNFYLKLVQLLWACRSEVCGIPCASPAWRLGSLVTTATSLHVTNQHFSDSKQYV